MLWIGGIILVVLWYIGRNYCAPLPCEPIEEHLDFAIREQKRVNKILAKRLEQAEREARRG